MLIPCRPVEFDLKAIRSTTLCGQMANVSMRILFNEVRAKSRNFHTAKKAVEVCGAPSLPCYLGD